MIFFAGALSFFFTGTIKSLDDPDNTLSYKNIFLTPDFLTLFGVFISMAGVILTAYVARQQDVMLLQIKDISQQGLAMKLQRDRANSYFIADTIGESNIVIFRYEESKTKGIPMTPVTEDFCLSRIGTWLHLLNKNFTIIGHDDNGVLQHIDDGFFIFLNSSFFLKPSPRNEKLKSEISKLPISFRPDCGERNMPCILATRPSDGEKTRDSQECSHYYDDDERYHAILGRLHLGKIRVFLLAGIEQRGTFVASHFVKTLIECQDPEQICDRLSISKHHHEVFSCSQDFICAISGQPAKDFRSTRSLQCHEIRHLTDAGWVAPGST